MKLTVKEEADTEKHVQELHDSHGFEIVELQFLYEALKQVRTCRRVLKWSYVYGYYLEQAGPAKNLFEYLQKNLEEKTDNLHELLEKDIKDYLPNKDGKDKNAMSSATPNGCLDDSDKSIKEKFMQFRSNVTNFSSVTKKFMEEILDGLSGDGTLTDVGDIPGQSQSR